MAGRTPTLGGSRSLFSFKGIVVRVHWSFLLLVAYIAYMGHQQGHGPGEIMGDLGMVLIVFACVVLHEFGHALTALHFGVRTRDITLLPIGGMANLERMPEDPRQEFWITIAGPLVNLAIALLALIAVAVMGLSLMVSDVFLGATDGTRLLIFVLVANLTLFLFNLIPAFPMDGGRILRAVLSMRLPRARATRIAATVGRVMAIGFVLFGLSNAQPFLALIGVFIFMAAGAEARAVEQQSALRGITVQQVMRTRFWSMPDSATVQQAVDELLAGGDHDLVVTDGGAGYRGVLTRRLLVHALSEGRQASPLGELQLLLPPATAPHEPVNKAYLLMRSEGHPLLPVVSEGQLLGILEAENLAEYLMIKGIRA